MLCLPNVCQLVTVHWPLKFFVEELAGHLPATNRDISYLLRFVTELDGVCMFILRRRGDTSLVFWGKPQKTPRLHLIVPQRATTHSGWFWLCDLHSWCHGNATNCPFDSFQVPTKDINDKVPRYPISIIRKFLYFCFIYRCHKLPSLLSILDYYCRIAVGNGSFTMTFTVPWVPGWVEWPNFPNMLDHQEMLNAFGTTSVPRKPIAFQLQVRTTVFCLLPFRCCTSAPTFRFQPKHPSPIACRVHHVYGGRGSKTFTNALHDAFFWSDELPHEDWERAENCWKDRVGG